MNVDLREKLRKKNFDKFLVIEYLGIRDCYK